MGHESWHEPYEDLTPETRDMHRAIISLMEELEAIDWYQQRADVTPDGELKAVMEHNRDEEIEHAIMTLEWIRRKNTKFDRNLRTYLFAEGPITEIEKSIQGNGPEAAPKNAIAEQNATAPSHAARPSGDGSLGVGSLNKMEQKITWIS